MLQVLVDGLSLGSLYALIALGIALIFGVMQLINFAHGELIMLSGFTMFLLSEEPVAVMVVGALAVPFIAALLMERVAFRPVRGADASTLLITSFALSFLIQHLTIVFLSSRPRAVTLPAVVTEPLTVGPVETLKLNVFTLVLAGTLMCLLALFLRRSVLGVQMRAASQDFLMARLLGVRANRVIAAAFAISGLLAGAVALVVVSQTGSVTPTMGLVLTLIGFVATVTGGLGSVATAAGGGLILGVVTVALQVYLPLELRPFRDAFLYAMVFVVLLVRPQGLLRFGATAQREL